MLLVLFHDGDSIARSNDVETAYRRVNPDDWDDDGIANERDANPTSYDGDFFGVANALPPNGRMKGQSLLIQVRQAKLGRTNSGRSYIVKKSTYD